MIVFRGKQVSTYHTLPTSCLAICKYFTITLFVTIFCSDIKMIYHAIYISLSNICYEKRRA